MKMLKKLIKVVSLSIVCIIVIYVVACTVQKIIWKDRIPSLFGIKVFVVLSGSMEPNINIGDIVVTRKADKVKEGDIISFKIKGAVITHRVLEVLNIDNQEVYTTKGDANTATDLDLVKLKDIEGTYFFKIPFIGKLILILQSHTSKNSFVVVLGIVLFLYINTKRINNMLGRGGKH